AAISLFAEIVTDERTPHIKAELKWLAHELAPVRDIDAFLKEALSPLRKEHPGERGLAALYRSFSRMRTKGYEQVFAAIESPRFQDLLVNTQEWIETGPWRQPSDLIARSRIGQPVEILAGNALARRRKKIRRQAAHLDVLDDEQIHLLRLRIKKIRYAAEFFAGLFVGKKAEKRQKKFQSTLRRLQNSLGSLNDIATRKS